jgi:hypothetical protein
VIAYNYAVGSFSTGALTFTQSEYYIHEAHSAFNLWEGNVGTAAKMDSIHGSNGYNTFYRNWLRGTSLVSNPVNVPTPPAPAITPIGGGSTRYSYQVVEVTNQAGSAPSAAGSTITGAATLDGTNYNRVITPSMSGSSSCKVYRTASGGTPSSTGYIGTVSCGSTLNDTGLVGDGKSPHPASDTPRQTVVSSPVGARGSAGINAWYTDEAARIFEIDALSSFYNVVGTILGSQGLAHLEKRRHSVSYALCGGPITTSCGAGSRLYSDVYDLSLGYSNSSDKGQPGSGTVPGYDTLIPVSTLFEHGVYTESDGTVTWAPSVTHTLPASFYLIGKPSWWRSTPFPAIGPDVSGGLADAFGYAHRIPAQVCYEDVIGGTNSGGSPHTFNADKCYSAAGLPTPTPPRSVVAIPH